MRLNVLMFNKTNSPNWCVKKYMGTSQEKILVDIGLEIKKNTTINKSALDRNQEGYLKLGIPPDVDRYSACSISQQLQHTSYCLILN